MKKVSLLLTFVAAFATASFAAPSVEKAELNANKTTTYKKGNVTFEVTTAEKTSFDGYSCTVSASWTGDDGKKSSIEITVNCGDCTTRQQACDKAYAVASIAIPG